MTTTLASLVVDGQTRPIELNLDEKRLELGLDGEMAFLDFHREGDVLALLYVEVPPRYRGRNLGDALSKAALEYARANGWQVQPHCPFIRAYIRRHPEYLHMISQ